MSEGNEVKIEVDGEELSAPRGSMLIQVTDKANIYVPRFCYHKELSIVANCRMCLVEVEGAPKPLPACATPVAEGMKVRTRSDKAVKAQQGTMEFLLINHPLDCPICDQGGECELQDLAMGYGTGVSQFTEGKRVVRDKNLGPLIKTDMTRCIHCTRCIRFGEEIAGLKELGATGRGEHMEIGTYIERAVVSELSGNVIDVCPVGALTSKPYQYSARTWEMKEAKGVAPHDMLGSNIFFHIKGQRVKRVVPQENQELNRVWLSDRDRFSYEGINSESRILAPRVKKDGRWENVGWETVMGAVCDRLRSIENPNDMAALASPSSTTEEFYLLQKLVRGLGCNNIDHRLRQVDFGLEAVDGIRSSAEGLSDIASSDLILLAGADPRTEVPLLNLRIREAALRGTKILVVGSLAKEINYPIEFRKTLPPSAIAPFFKQLVSSNVDGEKAGDGDEVDSDLRLMQDLLHSAERPLIISGGMIEQHYSRSEIVSMLVDLASILGGLYLPLVDGANSAGAWLAGAVPHRGPGGESLEKPGGNVRDLIEKPRKLYFLLGFDPELDCARSRDLKMALDSADFVVALSAFQSEVLDDVADVILPIAVYAENEGTLVNGFGSRQYFEPAIKPVGEARSAWKILRKLGGDLELPGFDAVNCREVIGLLEPKNSKATKETIKVAGSQLQNKSDKGLLEVLVEVPAYAVDQLVRHAESLQEMPQSGDDNVRLNEIVAANLHLSEGDRVGLEMGDVRAISHIKIDNKVARNTCVLAAGHKAVADVARNGALVRLLSMQGETSS